MFKDFQTEIKLFLIVVLVAVVISFGGILLLKTMQPAPLPTPPAQQTPPPTPTPPPPPQTLDTSDWQTYRNNKYGYEFQYPAGVTLWSGDARSSWPATGEDDFVGVGDLLTFTTVSSEMNAAVACSDLITEQAIRGCLGSAFWAEEDRWIPVTVDGMPAVRREITLKPAPPPESGFAPVGYIYYVKIRDTGLQISFGDLSSKQNTMNQILSTFRFVE